MQRTQNRFAAVRYEPGGANLLGRAGVAYSRVGASTDDRGSSAMWIHYFAERASSIPKFKVSRRGETGPWLNAITRRVAA